MWNRPNTRPLTKLLLWGLSSSSSSSRAEPSARAQLPQGPAAPPHPAWGSQPPPALLPSHCSCSLLSQPLLNSPFFSLIPVSPFPRDCLGLIPHGLWSLQSLAGGQGLLCVPVLRMQLVVVSQGRPEQSGVESAISSEFWEEASCTARCR